MATGSFERKSFTGGAAPTTLAGNISAGDTSITVADGSTYPTGATNPFVIVINRGTSTEEKVLIASRTNNVLTVDTRGYDDGTDQDHTLGETVEHVLDASTVDQANRYVNLQSAKGDLVAHDGTNPNAVNVGTNGDVLAADSTATNGVVWTNRLTTAESNITTLQGTDFDVTLTGDVTGTGTSTNLGNVSITTTIADDSHNHVIGNIDNFTEEVQDIVGGMVTGNTESGITVTYQDADGTLDFDVNDPVITLSGGVTGNATMTNLGNVTITTTVGDDTHNHIISNVDGLQTALNAKLDSSTYTANDILTKLKTVDGPGSGLNADTLDGISSGSFLRSDASDTMDGDLTLATGHVIKFEGSINDANELTLTCNNPTSDRTITFPNATGTVALTSSDITGNAATATYATSAGTAGSASTATSAGYATSAGNADTVDNYHASSFLLKTGGTVTGDTIFSAASSSNSDTVALQVTGSGASIALRDNGSASNSGSVVQVRSGRTGDLSRAMAYITQHDGTSAADINVNRVYYSGGSLGSSRTIKENIVSVHPAEGTSAYDTVKQIELSTFNYIGAETSDVQLGVIAEELIDVAPDFVEVHDGIPRWVKGSIHFLTLAALRQAISKIDALENEIASMQN